MLDDVAGITCEALEGGHTLTYTIRTPPNSGTIRFTAGAYTRPISRLT